MSTASEFFSGYRIDLENKAALEAGSTPYSQLMRSSDWHEADLFSWWHVRNQGNKGSCRGHSLAANAKLCYRLKAGLIDLDQDGVENEVMQDDFSADWCYYRTQKIDGIRGDNGATISGGIKVGIDLGIAREIDLPYNQQYQPERANDQTISAIAARFKFSRYTMMKTAQEAFDWVGSGQGGLDHGTVWPLPFVKGCLVKGMSRGQRGGGHATAGGTLIRGETLVKLVPSLQGEVKPDEWILQCMNSHSSSAQYKGFYFVTLEGYQDILEHQYTASIGWSDMSTPVVRPIDFSKQSLFG